jgi:hypothetical protein
MSLVTSLLTIYIWGVVCVLLFFLFIIGRFYEQKSGRRSFYQSFFVPIALFAIAALRYTFIAPAIVGDLWGDISRFLGGLVVGGVGFFLLRLMIGGRS